MYKHIAPLNRGFTLFYESCIYSSDGTTIRCAWCTSKATFFA